MSSSSTFAQLLREEPIGHQLASLNAQDASEQRRLMSIPRPSKVRAIRSYALLRVGKQLHD